VLQYGVADNLMTVERPDAPCAIPYLASLKRGLVLLELLRDVLGGCSVEHEFGPSFVSTRLGPHSLFMHGPPLTRALTHYTKLVHRVGNLPILPRNTYQFEDDVF
jgi:hypothetical protein